MAVFILIIYELLFGPASHHDNLGTALTWILWWPLLPLTFILVGRFWCAVCPFGTLSDVVQKLIPSRRPVPRFLRRYGIWIIDATFILITWADHVWGIVESPWNSGIVLLAIATAVVTAGAFWERRTWCRYLCFLGGFAGNYSRCGAVALRARADVCATCRSQACFRGDAWARGCPMFEYPRAMDSSAPCIVCAECVKACPRDSFTLRLRVPTRELWSIRRPRLEEAFLAVVIMGIVFVQNLTMLDVWPPLLREIGRIVHTGQYLVTFTLAFGAVILVPIALVTAASLLASPLTRTSLLRTFAGFGYAIIPLDVAGHVGHNLFHLLAEGKTVLFTAAAAAGVQVGGGSPAIADNGTIRLLQYALIALGTVGSLYAARRIARTGSRNWWAQLAAVPYAAVILLFAYVNVWLFNHPMARRM